MDFVTSFIKRTFRWKRYYFLYLFNFALSLILTFLFFQIFSLPLSHHKTKISEHPLPPERIYYFHDFDHDGFSEKVELKYQKIYDQPAIKVYNYFNKLIDQWNFLEPWIQNPIFGDYDHNHHDEVYILTHTNDSLFIYGLDIRDKKFFLYRKFITAAPRPLPNSKGIWDLESCRGTLMDINGDNYEELILLLNAGFALQPRNVFIFSIRDQKLLAISPKSGAKLGTFVWFDIDQDGKPEILPGTIATNNYHQPFPYSDNYSWLFVFDSRLNFLFNPIRLYPSYSSVTSFPFRIRDQFYVVTFVDYFGKLDLNPKIVLVDLNGNIVRETKLPTDMNWQFFSAPSDDPTKTYLGNSKGELFRIDEQLHLIKIAQFEHPIKGRAFSWDMDMDFKKEHIFFSDNGLLISEPNFKDYSFLDLKEPIYLNVLPQLRKRGHLPPELILETTSNKILHIEYSENPYYSLNYLIIGGTFLIYFVVLHILTSLIQRSIFIQRFTNYLLSHSTDGILLLNHKGKIVHVNLQMEQLLAMDHHIRLHRPYTEQFQDRPEIVKFINKLKHENRMLRENLHYIHGNTEVNEHILGFPVFSILNIPMGYCIEITNTTQQFQPERIRMWSKTVQKMAHDIKTPLSTIQLSLKTLEMKIRDSLSEQFRTLSPDFEMIHTELTKVRNITRDFLKFTNLEQPNYQLCSLQKIIQHSLEHFRNYLNGKLKIQLELDPQYDQIWADPQQLEMVFQIVLENAIDAMEGQGVILISSNLAQYLDRKLKSYVEIEIADTGPGIPESELEKVFEPYYTTKSEGTGMGLTIARKIIEDHRGEITIISRKDFATVVRIVLPVGNVGGKDLGENPGH